MNRTPTLPKSSTRVLTHLLNSLLPFGLLCGSLTASPALAASTAPEMDTELMQSLDELSKDLASNLGLRDRTNAGANATELQRFLKQVEGFYLARGDTPDAVGLSRQSLQLAQRVQEQVRGGQFAAAAGTATELARSCKACHELYKKER